MSAMDEPLQAPYPLSLLENYNFCDIDSEFSEFLRPFSLLTSTNKPSRTKKPSQPSARSLAKTYLPFINRCITLIPKRLTESPKNPKTIGFETELLKCFALCLDCLKAIAPELSSKPYCVQLQRAVYAHCLMRCERYKDAIREGFRVLEELGGVKFDSCRMKMGKFVPQLADDRGNGNRNGGGVDRDFSHLIVDLVVLISQCVSLSKLKDAEEYSKLKDAEEYTKLLTLLEEVQPWFRNMEESSSSKLQWRLLAYLKKIALFLVKETTDFEGVMVSNFCAAVFDEYRRLLNAQSHQAAEKGDLEEFLRFLSNCTYKCQFACKLVRDAVARHLYSSADYISEVLTVIQKLHALGLYFTEFGFEPKNCLSSKGSGGVASVSFSVEVWEKLQDLSALLSYGKKLSNGEEYISSYLNALKYLCCPLADFTSSERKRIIMEDMEFPIGNALKLISEAFLQYCHLFICCHQDQETCVEIDMTVLSISVSAFTLSLKLKLNFEEKSGLLNYVLSDECISLLRPQMLKYAVATLHNIFVDFWRHEQLKEASQALELCCKASWSRCLLFCEILVGKQKEFDGELSENMIAESVNEACKISCRLMDILHQIDSCTLEKVCEYSLKIWCSSKNLWEQLPCPVALIRHWVKLQCKLYRNTEGDASIMGSYLFQSLGIATNKFFLEVVGTILEQELVVYEEMSNFYPRFCRKMQMEIIEFLLHKVYHSTNYIQKSLILIKKGMLSRTSGAGGLDSCIHCLSEAIGLISGSSGVTLDKVDNQLAIVYCLRALTTHEANSTSKEIFEDVRQAVNIWKRIDIPCSSSLDHCDLGCEYVLLLLYHIADLLSIKGDTTLHSDVLSVIIKVLKQMNFTLEKCLLVLWETRRVNHALCVVPSDEAFVMALSELYGKDAESIDFWISSFEDSEPLYVGLQQNFSFLSSLFPLAFNQHKHSLQSELSIDEVKAIASKLISNDPVSHCSAYVAGYLYHDLSERLCAGGRIIEGLFCAKEAHRLRRKLLMEHFSYSIHDEDHKEIGKSMRKPSTCVSQFSVLHQAAIRAWPGFGISHGSDRVVLTSWSVLRCYLESTLQVGAINEKLGNVAEAEVQFRLGKNIACLQSLPQFIVSFSICLGKVYLGMNLFDSAKLELETSEQVMAVMRNSLTCSRCYLVLESSINDQLGNMYRKGIFSASENPYELSLRNLISLENGDISAWLEGDSPEHFIIGKEVHTDPEFDNRIDHECAAAITRLDNIPQSVKTKVKTETKRSRKVKKDLESQVTLKSCAVEQKLTRSRRLPFHGSKTDVVNSVEDASNSNLYGKLKSETLVVSNQVMCQKCFSSKHNLKGSFTYFIQMKWEFIRRRQILKLLIGLGKCKEGSSDTQRSCTIYYKCLTILLGGSDCYCRSSTLPELDSVGSEIPRDIFVGECAEVLYNLSWIFLTTFYSNDIRTRSTYSDLNGFQMSHAVSFLTTSFVLSREIPLLFQKVSRLLALIYVISASRKNLPSLSSCNVLPENYWAAYFHQASVGTCYNLQLLSAFTAKHRSHKKFKVNGYETAVETSMIAESCTLLRMVPDSAEEIGSYVQKFFKNLPSTTIVCASLLGASFSSLLRSLLCSPYGEYGWLLLSHLNADSEPGVVLLPLCTISQEEETSSSSSIFGENSVQEEWCAPWGCNAVVDDVVPLFKKILRGNYLSCSSIREENTERSREIWWTWRENLNKRLHKLLQDVEETWFGQCKYLLLGRWLDAEPLDSVVKEFMQELNKDGHKIVLNESILKIVMGGIKSMKKEKVKIPKVFLEKGCYIGNTIHCYQGTCDTPDEEDDGFEDVSNSLIAAVNKVELEYCTRREPVVLVLDNDVQMLPLENMPLMREQEVYRMPSVASILLALQRRSVLEEAAKLGTKFPLIDPLDAFYLLNPSGDLSRTQAEFEEWFRDQNMQGKAGVIPSMEELSAAIEKHDLFLYFGHGSGAQYMPRDKIQKLQSCSALLLMGCSSGSLNVKGRYAPVGTSLSYMMAGAPIVVANLWEVTDLDIDRFAKALLKSFLEERSMFSTGCIQCSLLAEEFKSMSVNERKRNTKKGRGKKKAVDPIPDDSGAYCFKHKLRIGYFVSQARKACKLPYLIGAAPVCYGVPTGIRKKKEI